MTTIATWTKDMEFRVDFPPGESVVLTSLPLAERPGPGPSPMEVVQAAVAACTGMDVVLILRKMRKTLTSLRIEIDATRRADEPRIYTHLVLSYHFDGPDLDVNSVRRAIELSQEKYCSVTAMLRPTVAMSYRVTLNGKTLDD
jgi:putative redox protein